MNLLYFVEPNMKIQMQYSTVLEVDGANCKEIANFYTQAAAAFSLPDYFGANLDALYDCMCDFDKSKNYAIYIQKSNHFLELENEELREEFFMTLSDIMDEINENRIVLRIFLEQNSILRDFLEKYEIPYFCI